MVSREDIKSNFQSHSGAVQEQLQDELLMDFELRRQVFDNVKQEVCVKSKKKPCTFLQKVFKIESHNKAQALLGKRSCKQREQGHTLTARKQHPCTAKNLLPFNGVSSKYLQNYLNWFAYPGKLLGTKSTIKQWFFAIIAFPTADELFLAFKHNAVNIRT